MKRLKKFMFNIILLIISSLFFRVISLFFNINISNKIGSEALGVFSLIMSVYMFGITFACSGINIVTTKVVAEELSLYGKESAKKIANKCITISFITGIIASILFFSFSDFIVKVCLHNRISSNVIYLIALALPFVAMSSSINGYFAGISKIHKNVTSKFIEQLIKIFTTAYLLSLCFPPTLEYACYSLILGDVISEISSFIYSSILYHLDIKYNHKKGEHLSPGLSGTPAPTTFRKDFYYSIKKKYFSFNKKRNISNYTKRILKISIPIALTSYIRSLLSTIKHILIPYSLEKSGLDCSYSFAQIGIINGMAMPIIMFAGIFITSFSELLIPEFSRYFAKKDFKRAKSITKFLLKFTTIFCTFITIILFLFSEKLGLNFYNNLEVGFYIKILSPLFIFIFIDNVIDSILKGLNKQVPIMLINIIDLFSSIILIYIFVPKHGVNGYIFSLFFSEIINLILSLFVLWKNFRQKTN